MVFENFFFLWFLKTYIFFFFKFGLRCVDPKIMVFFVILKVAPYIFAQIMGSVMATYSGMLVYGIKSDLMTTRPLQGSTSAFFVELIATFIIMFVAASLTQQAQSVRKIFTYFSFALNND